MIVNILLLEDNENIAQSFIRNFSSELVRVKVVKTIAELFHELSNQEFDTIIIDPIMSATMDFPRLLEELSKKRTEIKIAYPNQIVPYFKDHAEKKNIENVSLKDTEQLFSIIESLLKRKSGNTLEIKETNKQLEIRVIKTEVHLDNLITQVNKQGEKIESIEEEINQQSVSLIELKNNQTYMIDTLTGLRKNVGEIAIELDEINKEDPGIQLQLKDKEESTKRFLAIIGIITAVFTTLGVISVPLSSVIIEHIKQSQVKEDK